MSQSFNNSDLKGGLSTWSRDRGEPSPESSNHNLIVPNIAHLNPSESDRLAARIGGAFFLEAAVAVSDAFDGDLIRGLIAMELMQLQFESAAIVSKSGSPAEGRKSTTVYAVAKSLGLNYETTRRHFKRLVDEGYCQRLPEGFVTVASAIERPELVRVIRKLSTLARRAQEHLNKAGSGDP